MYLIAANWKMHKNARQVDDFFRRFKPNPKVEIVIFPPSVFLERAAKHKIQIGSQNIHYEKEGPFTGETSLGMVKDFCSYILIGHSERRKFNDETDKIVNKKLHLVLKNNKKAILCVGESLAIRKKGRTKSFVLSQLRKGLEGISSPKNLNIAYEPIWAIGTGVNATPEHAQEVHSWIAHFMTKKFGKNTIRILYGGSVTPDNARSLLQKPDIKGLLVGGASLDPKSFSKICHSI